MQALVYTAPGEVVLQHHAGPRASSREVVLEVLAAGICGSDLEGVRATNSLRVPPLVMGHELIGRRSDTGETVAVNPLLSCGSCDLCALGQRNLCRARELIGIHRPGGFAELVAVPEHALRPLPAGLNAERAVLAEPIANAVHALRLAERHLGRTPRTLGIIGAGMLGIACALVATADGGARVAIADLDDARLAMAADTLPVDAARTLTDEYDVVVDAVGARATRALSVQRLRPGGVAVWIGLRDPDPGFDSLALVRGQQLVAGTFAYLDDDFDAAMRLCAQADPSWIEEVPLRDAAGRFGELMRRPAPVPKTAIRMPAADHARPGAVPTARR